MNSITLYKTYLNDYLEKYHNINNTKKFFTCLNPNHIDNNPSMIYTDKYNICKCFSCGVSYDIFDLVGIDYNLDNFKEKIEKVQEIYFNNIDIKKENKPIEDKLYDYTNYYDLCVKNIDKTNYLQKRGINESLLQKYRIGFDEKRNLVVFPINKNCYFARSTVNNDKIKSKGSSDIWNKHYLYECDNSLIYVTEGIIDSLSLETIDPNIKTISINGVGNINSLIYNIKNSKYSGNIVIVFDNDNAGQKASEELKRELTALGVNSFSTTMIKNFKDIDCKDLNSALMINRELLESNYNFFNETFSTMINKKNEIGVEKDGCY